MVLSIINTDNNSISLSEFINLQSVKNLKIKDEEILSQLKNLKEISIPQDQNKFFINFNFSNQIFIFNLSHKNKSLKDLSFLNSQENFAKEFSFENKQILRMKELENNSLLIVLNSGINIKENHQKIIANKNVNLK